MQPGGISGIKLKRRSARVKCFGQRSQTDAGTGEGDEGGVGARGRSRP